MRQIRPVLAVASLLAASLASAGSLSTLYAADNEGGSLWTNYFDVTALTAPLSVTGFGLNVAESLTVSSPGLAFSIDVYTRSGTYSGNEASAAGWVQRASGSGTTAGLNSPSMVALSTPFSIPVGTSGLAIRYTVPGSSGVGPVYTNGTATNTAYANADLRIAAGSSQASTAAPFSGSLFANRVWNGTINYNPVPEPSTLAALAVPLLGLLRRRRKAVV